MTKHTPNRWNASKHGPKPPVVKPPVLSPPPQPSSGMAIGRKMVTLSMAYGMWPSYKSLSTYDWSEMAELFAREDAHRLAGQLKEMLDTTDVTTMAAKDAFARKAVLDHLMTLLLAVQALP